MRNDALLNVDLLMALDGLPHHIEQLPGNHDDILMRWNCVEGGGNQKIIILVHHALDDSQPAGVVDARIFGQSKPEILFVCSLQPVQAAKEGALITIMRR